MCMQEADVAHEGQVSELKSTVQHGVDQLKEKEVEIKKLMKSAEEKDQKIQELKDDNEKLAQTNDNHKEMLKTAAQTEEAKAENEGGDVLRRLMIEGEDALEKANLRTATDEDTQMDRQDLPEDMVSAAMRSLSDRIIEQQEQFETAAEQWQLIVSEQTDMLKALLQRP